MYNIKIYSIIWVKVGEDMSYINQLFKIKYKKIYHIEATNDLFFKAMKQNCIEQYERCETYREILNQKGFNPYTDLKQYTDIQHIPTIPTLYFKHNEMISMSKKKMLIKATSSGTSGKQSLLGFNFKSLYRGLKMVLSLCKYHKLISLKPVHYVIFGYEPNKKNQTAISKSTYGFTFFAPAKDRTFVLKFKNDAYELDIEGVKQALIQFSKGKTPVRTHGFPAYTYFVLKQMKEEGVKVQLPKGSKLAIGGGWKQFYAEKIEKRAFYDLVYEVLGIEDSNIIEFFSAVEHPVLYADCRCHHFHIPVYSRVIIRDVDTLEPLENGKVGLIQFLTPMVDAMPLLSVMTDDLGVIHTEKCACGAPSPYLEIIGRVGIQDIVTCAAGAEEILKK